MKLNLYPLLNSIKIEENITFSPRNKNKNGLNLKNKNINQYKNV